MRINVYYPEYNLQHFEVLKAFAEGLPEACLLPSVYFSPNDPPDVAVIFGVYKKHVPKSVDRGLILQNMPAENVLVLETGYVKRDQYYACGWGGLNGRADFKNDDKGHDRWIKLGVDLEPWKAREGYILVCGQVPWDASVQHHNHVQWCIDTCSYLKGQGFDVRFSPHPLGPMFEVDGIQTVHGSMEEKLKGAEAVVTFNSNCAVDSVIAGVPAVAIDKGSMAWDVTSHDLKHLCFPAKPDRWRWMCSLAYTQWNLDEFRSGEAWEHISGN